MKIFIAYLLMILSPSLLATGQNMKTTKFSHNIYDGTTIIVSVLPDRIIIGADSKQTPGGDESDPTDVTPLKCKIRHIGNFFFAASGHTKMIKPDIDILRIIENLKFNDTQTFHQKVIFVENMLKDHVNFYVTNFEKFNPISFSSLLNKNLLTVSFSDFENGKPVSEAVSWELKSDNTGWIITSTVLTSNQIPRFMILGHKEGIDSLFQKKPDIITKYDEEAIKYLIELQANSNPKHVGLPIDLVVLTSSGFEWKQKKQECN